ncbi:MAG: hypothetical protein GX455_14080 [Phycisphaerae bacterium]|nr:hypothetical protein [Phycisphaerae bacterium]
MDCNSNGIPDECDIANGISLDCNGNGIPDLCDISTGLCEDENNNGIPDECERLQGQIHLNFWNDIWKGTLEESIAWSNTHYPSSANRSDLCHYEDPSVAPLYILKVWGWLIPPATGEYTFWISSEDKSALWLSSDSNPIEPDIQTSICQDTMGSPPHAWFTRPSQQSNPIHLEKDIPYYFTAIGQKEHREYYLSIGWAGPTIGNIATGNVIVVDGRFISTDRPEQDCNGNGIFDNIDLSLCSSQDCNQNSIPDECDIAGETSRDCNGNGIPDECELSYVFNDCNGNEILDECDITQGTSQDLNGDGIPDECGRKIPGLLRREIWDWASYTENLVGSIQWIQTQPYTSCDQLESFDFSSRNTDYYIARLWGWLTPPASGDYTFWIASDNNSGLWIDTQLKSIFSTTAICTVVGRTEYQEWNSMPSQQKSKPIYLQQGVSYPVVAIMNEGKYGDYLSVAWAGPGIGNSPTIIQGQYLAAIIPYRDCNGNAVNDFDEIKQGICSDCNQNEYPDECDIFQGTSQDCNANGSPDECDIVSETSRDLNGDKIPDECQVDVRVEPVVVLVDPAGTSEVRTQLPESIAAVVRGGRYFVEIWASDVGVVNTGLTGMYVDVGFCGQTQATQLNNGGIFTEFASGTIQSGKVDEFGGSALPSGGGIGPEWVRVGWLTISADVDIPTCKIELQPSSSGIAALTRGLINWAYVQLGSRTIQILPPARSYDLDGDKTIGVGDLSLFAGSWQKLVPPATAGHDFDCDNFVGVGDLSWFATGWLKATNNPTILYPACTPPPSAGIPLPPSSWPGTIPSPPVMEDVLVGLALRDTASSKDTASNLPDSVGEIVPGGTYYLEVWSSDAGDINTGLTSVYVDLEFTEGAVTVANVSHGGIFTQFKGGTVGTAGIVNLGGSTLTQGVGGNPVWARLAVIMLTAKQHKISFMLKPSAWGVSAYGRGTIPWSKIAMGNLEYPSIGRWDINQNMRVEFDDFSIISENWLLSGANLSGDFDKSGWVTIEDLAEFVNHWLEE